MLLHLQLNLGGRYYLYNSSIFNTNITAVPVVFTWWLLQSVGCRDAIRASGVLPRSRLDFPIAHSIASLAPGRNGIR